jgi:hypothetical protein
MKLYKLLFLTLLIFAIGCDKGYIDDITPKEAGPDEEEPVIDMVFPKGDIVIPFTDEETDLDIQIEVTDDIEISTVQLTLDGTNLATYNDFTDYRRFLSSYLYEDLQLGDHTLEITATDESGKTTTETLEFNVTNKYTPKYDGEIFYMPFEGGLYTEIITEIDATVVGNPGFTDGYVLNGYQGADSSYLTFPAAELMNDEFSAVMWYNVDNSEEPNRAGILVIGPPNDGYPVSLNNGFKFFREAAGDNQRIKLNAGNGTGYNWFDGGADADIDPGANTWVHLAFTISGTECKVYINGEVVREAEFPGISWDNCETLSIMSGAPNFVHWNHRFDRSLLDELRIFDKALTQGEIQAIIDDES